MSMLGGQRSTSKMRTVINRMYICNKGAIKQILYGVGVISIPVMGWWYWSIQERNKVQETFRTKVRIPNVDDTYDYIISEKCKPGDVILFDRKCELCISPWSALSCYISKYCFKTNTNDDKYIRSVDNGTYNHCGIIVPGYVKTKNDQYDPTNLLLLEATSSDGIVARPLKDRLEQSQSNSILLLQLCCPGEQRNNNSSDSDNNKSTSSSTNNQIVERTRQHIERELINFRNQWIDAGLKQNYKYIHNTVTIGGAIAYKLNIYDTLHVTNGPVSPTAFTVLNGLQKAAIATNINDHDTKSIKVEDFLRDYRFTENDAVRLRPGYRFLAPIPLKQKY